MEVELVGAGDEVVAVFEAEVHDDEGLEALRRDVAGDALQLVEGFAGVQAVERAGGHDLGDADRAEEAGRTADVKGELVGGHGAQIDGAGDRVELGLVDLVIAAKEGGDRAQGSARVGGSAHEGDALDVLRSVDAEEAGDVGDGAEAGGGDELGEAVACGFEVFDGGEARRGFLEVGSVAGGGGGDEVFAGFGVDHELLRL